MENNNFQKFYSQLNPEQKEAVDTLEGPVMVIAGPGTGKTQVLTLRIANILVKNRAKPEEILSLTFTDSGVTAMRKRLLEILGVKAYYVPIFTFHAFCNEIIQENPDDFPQFFEKNLVDEISAMQIVEGIIKSEKFNLLRPFGDPFMYVPSLIKSFSNLKREGISPSKFKELVDGEDLGFGAIGDLYYEKGPHKGKMKGKYKDLERNIEKNKELALAYYKYQEKLKELGYDYDEMILSVVLKMENDEAFLQKLQERFKYILADEHQDTNQAQNKVLELLCSHADNPNIFVVGDEKQAIYRFQGANLRNFLYFHTRFPNSKIITLRRNYRSTQSILDASDALILNNSQQITSIFGDLLKSDLISEAAHPEKKVRVYGFRDIDTENYFIANKIKKLIKDGASASEIAVLYRNNNDAMSISQMLGKNGIAVRVESDEELLLNEDIKTLFNLMRTVSEFGKGEYLAKILYANFLNIPALDAYKIFQPYRQDIGTIFDVLRSKKRLRLLGVSKAVRINNIYKKIAKWASIAQTASVPQIYEKIVRESGLLQYLLTKRDYIYRLNQLRYLHQLSKKLSWESKSYNLRDFVRDLEFIQDKNVSFRVKNPEVLKNAVRLMTAHRSKGLEFDYVFITSANHGHWGHKRTREMIKLPMLARGVVAPRTESNGSENNQINLDSNYAKLDDERRLFYVALTRARQMVYISYSRFGTDGRDLFPSQFIEEIPEVHKVSGNSELYERNLEKRPEIIFRARKETVLKNDEEEFLREVFKKKGLSPTALNNYIACPWRYFYNNLLQIPRAKTKHEMYGTAMHAALKNLFDSLDSTGSDLVESGQISLNLDLLDFLLRRFEYALSRELISDSDFNESRDKGKEVLAKYYENYKNVWHKDSVNEFAIKSVFFDLLTPGQSSGQEIRLTGKIDKIEKFGNGEVNVVDYKTGKRKTRNTLLGTTKNSTGNEKRQLIFYKILLDSLPDFLVKKIGFRPIMVSGEIDFVEPDKRTGRFYKEKFVISEEDIRQLKDTIREVSSEIINFAFWNKTCKDQKCEWCELRKIMVS